LLATGRRIYFVNADGDKLSMAWFKDRINHYATTGIRKIEVLRYRQERSTPGILLPAWLSGGG